MNVSAQDVISILSIFATIVIGVRSFLWSKEYREAKQAEMDTKEAGFLAKESEYKSQLASKDERIRFFELIADPKYVDKVEKIIEDQKSNIKKLQDTIQQLKDQLSEANNQIDALKQEITKLSISDSEKDNLNVFVTGSSLALDNLGMTAGAFAIVSEDMEKSTDEIIMFPPREGITFDTINGRPAYIIGK